MAKLTQIIVIRLAAVTLLSQIKAFRFDREFEGDVNDGGYSDHDSSDSGELAPTETGDSDFIDKMKYMESSGLGHLALADMNRDGVITREELQDFLVKTSSGETLNEQQLNKFIADLDVNQDGVINRQDFTAKWGKK